MVISLKKLGALQNVKFYLLLISKYHITSNDRQTWRPDWPMGFIVSSTVGGVNEHNSTANVCLCR